MGLGIQLAELIVMEHRYRPVPRVVHTLGKLYTGFDQDQAAALMRRHGVDPRDAPIELDTGTVEARRSKPCITDRTFFKMLGAEEVHAIDISPYEGADIVWDLCKPIPDRLAGVADFVVGGSTLDNVWDPAQYIRNMARMLRSGGRLFEHNHANNHNRPYSILTAAWLFDFFVVNRFADCRVAMLEFSNAVHLFNLYVRPNVEQLPGSGLIDNFDSDDSCTVCTVLFAEKGNETTWDVNPVQDSWRGKNDIQTYNENLATMLASTRPTWEFRESSLRSASKNRTSHNYRYAGHF